MAVDRIESNHFPYLPITVRVGSHSATVEALIDTGFDGYLAVPSAILPPDQSPNLLVQLRLADGSVIEAPAYVGTISVGSFSPFLALITVIGDEPIVGRSVTDRYRIILEHGQRVIVEP